MDAQITNLIFSGFHFQFFICHHLACVVILVPGRPTNKEVGNGDFFFAIIIKKIKINY